MLSNNITLTLAQVLNMKAVEILGMVEEAAGTRTFEERKASARKTMEKKQKDIDNLNEILLKEITPTLDRLREEKQVYIQYQKATRELESTERLLAAMEWTEAHKQVEEARQAVAENAEEIGRLDGEKEKMEGEIDVSQKEKARGAKEREKELKRAGKASELEKKIRDLKSDKAQAVAKAEGQETEIRSEEKIIRGLEDEQKKVSRFS